MEAPHMNEIEKLKERFVEHLLPMWIYLFGPYANIMFTNESDLDFYIVFKDNEVYRKAVLLYDAEN